MKEKEKYLFYVLSSSDSPEQFRYLGTTCRKLNQRLSHHKYVARSPEKRSTPVSKWIFSLFEKGLDVIITKIYECEKDLWEETEINLIKEYKNLGYDLLNVDSGGRGSITIEKRNKSGIQRSIKAHQVKVVQLSLKGEYIKTYDSIMFATKEMGLSSKSAIGNVLSGRSKTSCGFYWVYESDYISGNYTLQEKIDPSKHLGIRHYQYSIDTHELIKIHNSEKAIYYEFYGSKNSNTQGLNTAIMQKIAWNDFYWSKEPIEDFSLYFDNRFKVLEIDLNNNIVNKFKNNKEAAVYFGVADCTISNQIRNKTKTKNNTILIKNEKIKI